MEPTFSIVTCTWNSERFLAKSIASVLAQDFSDFEYIFVDGGSNDRTLEMIQSLPRPFQLIHGVRGGISRAMNVGIGAAHGRIVAHLHSDDYYAANDVLTKVLDAFNLPISPKWVFGRIMSEFSDGRVAVEAYKIPRYSYDRLMIGNFVPHPATFVLRRMFDHVGYFDEELRYAMDYDMWLRLGQLGDPVQLDTHLAVFRRHAESLSTANPLQGLREDFSVRRRYLQGSILDSIPHVLRFAVRLARLEGRRIFTS